MVLPIELEVQESYPNDLGRGIVRLDPETVRTLEVDIDDVVGLKGGDVTAGTAKRADRQDWDTGTVRIDAFTRQNADVALGDEVTLQPVSVKPALHLILSPPPGASEPFGSETVAQVQDKLSARAVMEGDLVPVLSGTDPRFLQSLGHALPFLVESTDPEGAVIVTDDTTLTLRDPAAPGEQSLPGTATVTTDIDLCNFGVKRTDAGSVTVSAMVENQHTHPLAGVRVTLEFYVFRDGTRHATRYTLEKRQLDPGQQWTFTLEFDSPSEPPQWFALQIGAE